MAIREPYTSLYHPRANLDELDGPVRLAYWSWEGNIKKDVYDANAHRFVRYKIVNRVLYRHRNYTMTPAEVGRSHLVESMIKIAVLLYPLPDMEFAVNYGDGSYAGIPVLNMCVDRGRPQSGFTLPTPGPWLFALGPMQTAAMHACLWDRYPADKRKPLLVWRGSATGWARRVDEEHCLALPRVRMHMLSRQHPDLFDTRLTSLTGPCPRVLEPLINDTATFTNLEAVNGYCAVLDLNGNSWSDRFQSNLLHFPTLIIKEASNITGYAEHFFAPGHSIDLFNPTAPEPQLLELARRVVEECKKGEGSHGQYLARRAQATAGAMLDHVGMVRAMAYALWNFRRLSDWEPGRDVGEYDRQAFACCERSTLPRELLEALAARDQELGLRA